MPKLSSEQVEEEIWGGPANQGSQEKRLLHEGELT